MRPVRWTLWVPLLLFSAFCVLVAIQLMRPAAREVESAMIGKPLPKIDLPAASPDRPGVTTEDLTSGEPKLLNIFASWCVPCAAEAPQLAELERRGANIVGVAIRDRPEDVARFLAQYGNPYSRIGADNVSEIQFAIGSSGVPETFVIDGDGVIRYQHIGDIRAENIELLLQRLKEAGG